MHRIARVIGWVGALTGIGCGTTTAAVDAGPRTDTGPAPQAVVATAGGTVDLSCVGTATTPTPGAPTAASLHVYEYLSHAAITSGRIELFTNDRLAATCTAPDCSAYVTDASGNVPLVLGAGQWFAMRLAESGQSAPLVVFDQPWVADSGEVSVPAFSPSTINEVGMLISRTFDASSLACVSGRAVDCAGHVLANVRPRVFVDGTEVLSGALSDRSSPRITGLEGAGPTRTGLTGSSGDFVGANIPVSASVRIETWGTLTADTEPVLIGCMEGSTVVGGITATVIGPLRSDYAAGSGCALAAASRP